MDIEQKARMSARLADVIRDHMRDTNTSMVALATATSIPRTTLIRKLDGTSPLDVIELTDIAQALGMSADNLYRDARITAMSEAA